MVIFLCDPLSTDNESDVHALQRLCDLHSVPIATNIATAEMLILGLDRGDLSWREVVSPKRPSRSRNF